MIYDDVKISSEWKLIETCINDLLENKDILITTQKDYVIGYITKKIIERKT